MIEITKEEFEKYSEFGKLAHPDQVMKKLIDLITKIGATKFLHGAGLNEERDSFVAVMFAYGIRKWSKREWFIQQIQDPPDFYVASPTERTLKDKPMDRLGVEVVEIRDETTELAIDTLERTKLTNYDPGEGTILLIFINSKIGLKNLEQISLWIARNKERFSKFSEVYILFLGPFTPETLWTFTLLNILKPWSMTCSIKEEFNKGIVFPHPLIDKYMVKFTNKTFFIIGASGAGKTTAIKKIQALYPDDFHFCYFDSIGVPSNEEMVKQYGSPEGWQKKNTEVWVKKIKEELIDSKRTILDGQTRPSFIDEACTSNDVTNYKVVLFDTSDEVRKQRLIKRGHAELANDQMMNWAKYLREESSKYGYKIIDNTDLTEEETVATLLKILNE